MQNQNTYAILTDLLTRSPLFIMFGDNTVIRPAPIDIPSGQQSGTLQAVKSDARGTQILVDGYQYYVLESFHEVVSYASGGSNVSTDLLSQWNKRAEQTRRTG